MNFSPSVFAQSEPIQPKFSIGFSLNIPTDIRFCVRDIAGLEGFAVRADLGGFYFVFGAYVQAALNLEYHFAEAEKDGFYFGLGLTLVQSLLGVSGAANQSGTGIQAYLGLELGVSFFEVGVVQFLESGYLGINRLAFGFNLYF